MADAPTGDVVVYEAPGGEVRVDVRLEWDTVWLSQRQMADLFDTSTDNVGLHLKKIFDEGELLAAATAEDYSVVQAEGGRRIRRRVKHYNLDAIISVGYRVNSKRGTQFRIWATRTLREHLLRGFTLHERRLRETGLGDIEQAAQEYLAAGLVDEMRIDLVPTLLGRGERLFDGVGDDLRGLELVRTIAARKVTHLEFAKR